MEARSKELNVHEIGEFIKADYRMVTAQYRSDDEIEVLTENHRRLADRLRQLSSSFSHPISTLDVGCGTGRYFHCLVNVKKLVGLDISEEMLEAARHPVRHQQVTVPDIELRCGNAHVEDFGPTSFDFIYSLGMFGHGCPITVDICERFHGWLKPGGILFFNVLDFDSLPLGFRVRRQVRQAVYPFLPRAIRGKLDARERKSPFFYVNEAGLRYLLEHTPFSSFEICSEACKSPLGFGRHLECEVRKAS